jgi:hypothetical protein
MISQALADNTIVKMALSPINNANRPITLNATSANNQKTNPTKWTMKRTLRIRMGIYILVHQKNALTKQALFSHMLIYQWGLL